MNYPDQNETTNLFPYACFEEDTSVLFDEIVSGRNVVGDSTEVNSPVDIHVISVTTTPEIIENRIGINRKGKLGANAMKRVSAGAHLPTTWLFEPAKRSHDSADYCLHCQLVRSRKLEQFLQWTTQY